MGKIHSTKSGIKKILTITLISILLVGLIIAVNFEQVYNPFTQKLDYYRSLNMSGENLTIGNVTADYFFGDGSQLTGIDIPTITDVWVNESGDIMTGNLNMSNNNITDVNYLKLTNSTITWNIYVNVNGTLVFQEE